MSRGVVLWPDAVASAAIEALWHRLDEVGIPSLASLTHRRHRPHMSLIVGEQLDPEAAIDALGPTPPNPIPLRIEAVGAFPEGVLFLHCVMNDALSAEHRRVSDRVSALVQGQWPYFAPESWSPHITLGTALARDQLGRGLGFVLDALPIDGCFDTAGIEDGSSGDAWPIGIVP